MDSDIGEGGLYRKGRACPIDEQCLRGRAHGIGGQYRARARRCAVTACLVFGEEAGSGAHPDDARQAHGRLARRCGASGAVHKRADGCRRRAVASPARQIPLLREAGRSSSKHSSSRTLRVLQRRTRSGSAPPSLATPVGAITASLSHGRPKSTSSGRRTPHPWISQLGGTLCFPTLAEGQELESEAGIGGTERLRQDRPFLKEAASASIKQEQAV